jgi:pteridine reductase
MTDSPSIADSPAARPVALVTGAARRIGAAIASHLHAGGYDVIVHYRSSSQEATDLVDALNRARAGSATAIGADLSRAADCAALVERAAAWRGGRLDALVNNASSFRRTPLGTIDEAAWHELVDGNLKAALFCSQAAAPWLRATGGAIVNLCDVHTERPLREFSVYSAAKAGIVALTRALALELAPAVRVNAVSPGSLDWPEDGIFTEAERRATEAAIPLARLGTGEDIARAVEFLLRGNRYVTGHVLAVDGGASLVSR